jgi:hypothetical protein
VTGQSRQTAAAGRQTRQPAGLGGVPVIIVRGYIPVPDRVTFTAAELAARLAELGESEAAATATAIARGAPLDLGEIGQDDRGAGQHPGRPTALRPGHRRPVPPGRLAAASGGLLSGPRRPDPEMEAGP